MINFSMGQSGGVREAVVAGRFYESDAEACRASAEAMTRLPDEAAEKVGERAIVGGIMPHAGWVCSGRVAGMTAAAMRAGSAAQTIFLTGSVHTVPLECPALDDASAWATPVGEVAVDGALRRAISELDGFQTFPVAHEREHALEVVLPLLRVVFGEGLKIVPCMIPPRRRAVAWGEALGELLSGWAEPVLVVASSDLTHYGPNYGFTPEGVGEAGRRWASEVNDQRLLNQIEALDETQVVETCLNEKSACGGGAIAATMAAAGRLGATEGIVLEHTDSATELERVGHMDRRNSVGYASVVYA